MLQQISWASYCAFLFYALLCYYLVVLLLYYRKDLRWAFAHYQAHGVKGKAAMAPTSSGSPNKETKERTPGDHPQLSSVHELLEDLKILLRSAATQGFQKEELLMALEMQLRPYAHLKDNTVRPSIDAFIVEEIREVCAIAVEEKEVAVLWKAPASP